MSAVAQGAQADLAGDEFGKRNRNDRYVAVAVDEGGEAGSTSAHCPCDAASWAHCNRGSLAVRLMLA